MQVKKKKEWKNITLILGQKCIFITKISIAGKRASFTDCHLEGCIVDTEPPVTLIDSSADRFAFN